MTEKAIHTLNERDLLILQTRKEKENEAYERWELERKYCREQKKGKQGKLLRKEMSENLKGKYLGAQKGKKSKEGIENLPIKEGFK